MIVLQDIVLASRAENAVDPPSNPVAQAFQLPQGNMDGNQLAQWLSVQASSMFGDLQHRAPRALTLRASSPMPVADGHEEVAHRRQQLRHQQQAPS